MSTSIVELISGDRGPELSNASGARTLSIGTNWNVIRLGILVSFSDLGSNPSGTPRFYCGALNGTTAANHVLKSTTTNFIGCVTDVASWTRNAGPPVYYSTSSSLFGAKKITTTLTKTAAIGSWTVSADGTVRNVLLVELTKGSPNWTIQLGFTNSATGAQTDKTLAILKQALEAATMANAITLLSTGYTGPAGVALAFDETAGSINAAHFAWDKTSFTARLYAIGYAKIS